MRKKHACGHTNHERWLVSYADFITLLFAFFVVMFASSQTDKTKTKAVSESVKQALEKGSFSSAITIMLGRGKHEVKKAPLSNNPTSKQENPDAPPPALAKNPSPEMTMYLENLATALKADLINGKVQIKLEARGLVISMREAAFFGSGGEVISPSAIPILERIVTVVQQMPNAIRLEGHTDSRPIHNGRFRSNWELSAARSIAMLEILRDRFGVEQSRMAVAGYADHSPSDTNDTEEGRGHNRRVDLVLLAPGAMTGEPAVPR